MKSLMTISIISLFVLPAQAKYSGGTGELNDPYQIATAEDLILLGESPEDYDKHFILTADIDLDPNLPGRKVFDKAIIAPKPFWEGGTSFTGVFDGNGHIISNLNIQGMSYLGLFGYLGSRAKVRNLGVVDANITGTDIYAGCLVGRNEGSISASYSSGSIKGNRNVGGLVGYNGSARMTGCYSSGSVKGNWNVGGLVGTNDKAGWGGADKPGFVTESYSTGPVSCTYYNTSPVSGIYNVGGLVGSSFGGVSNCFWDIETSGQTMSAGGTGKTTAEMKDPNTFMAAGWDFVGQLDGPHDTWAEPPVGGYPILWWQLSLWPSLPQFSGGTGEPNNPYRISMAKDLNSIGHNLRLMECHFRLVVDLDMTSLHFYPIGNYDCPYGGFFDGNGHTISHLTIKDENNCGMFVYLGHGAEVKNLGIVDVNIAGSGDFTGGLVGFNYGTVTNCYSTGTVSGDDRVGGLVGRSEGGSVIQCYNTASVSGRGYYVGGLVAQNSGGFVSQCYNTGLVSGLVSWVGGLVAQNTRGTVTNCYSTGSVSGMYHYIGGLLGSNGGSVTHCYSTGSVNGGDVGGLAGSSGSVTQCFWDVQTSGQTLSFGGTGKTTAEMQTGSTFLDAGWDFVDEIENGTDDIWWILEGQHYPRLWWQYGRAFSPYPQNGAVNVPQPLALSWTHGGSGLYHDVYFGEDEEAVINTTTESPEIYRGRQEPEMTTYYLDTLKLEKTYYWRIDEVNITDTNGLPKGNVWSFTTADFIIVDDFESYNDPDNPTWRSWFDGLGYGLGKPDGYPGNGTGSAVGDEISMWSQVIVHSGRQSMSYYYDNDKKGYAYYSEAEKTLSNPRNWTERDVTGLSLWFRGRYSNDSELMYVAIVNKAGEPAVIYHDDPNAARIDTWTEWIIPLQSFVDQGIDLIDVDRIAIGFGTRGNLTVPGGRGKVYFDDIRLYPSPPESNGK